MQSFRKFCSIPTAATIITSFLASWFVLQNFKNKFWTSVSTKHTTVGGKTF